MTDADAQPLYQFGEFVLDTSRGVLLENGVEVSLRPQSIVVLQVLLEHHGRLVSKDELHDRVWGRKAVTDDSLAQCIVEIRKALHDTDREWVRTMPRRGYLFEGDVSILQATDEAKETIWSGRARRAVLVAAVLLVAALGWLFFTTPGRPPAIAVLPFDDLSAAQDLQFMGDGLAEDILNSLAHNPEISVIARTSSFAYSTRMTDIVEIGDELGVDYILEGSVRDTNDDVFRVVAQLIETGAGSHVWSDAFEIGFEDLARVQEHISQEVWQQIAPTAKAAQRQSAITGFTEDELMMVARQNEILLREAVEVDSELLASAIRRYRNATTVNPDSAKAQAGLARVLLISGDLVAAKSAVAAALRADSESSEVQEVLGRYRWLTGEPGAGEAWRKAVALNPNSADAIGSHGYWLWMQGRMGEAEPYLFKALDLDLASLSRYADVGNFLGNEARVEEVHDLIKLIRQRFDSAESYRVIARMLDLIGEVDESIAWLTRARIKDPDNPVYNWALTELFVDIGDYETALRLDPGPSPGLVLKMGRYTEFIAMAEDKLFDEPGDLVLRYLLAFAYNATGEHRLAIWQLDRARVIDHVLPEVRQIWDLEAALTWVDAMDADGQHAETIKIANYMMFEFPHTSSSNWWHNFYDACLHSTQGMDEEALAELERVSESPRLPFLYLFRDARCLQKYRSEPRYIAMLDDIEARQREIRAQVPTTLERHGLNLPELAIRSENQ